MKNNKAAGCNGIPAEAWKMLVTNTEGTEILTELFNMIRSKRNFPKEWKTALIQPIEKGKKSQSQGTIVGFHYYQVWRNCIQE